jgi:hypothetical protein
LTVHSVNPLSVFARTKDFALHVFGMDLPEDARIYVSGRPVKTTRVSATEVTATVGKQFIAAPGQLQVEVKNSTGELYSNPLMITVQQPPEPTYKYIGRIDNYVYLRKQSDEPPVVALLGKTLLDNRWRVERAAGDNLMLQDVVLEIPYTIELEANTVASTSGNQMMMPMTEYQAPIQQRGIIQQGNVQPGAIVQPGGRRIPRGAQPAAQTGDTNPTEEEDP